MYSVSKRTQASKQAQLGRQPSGIVLHHRNLGPRSLDVGLQDTPLITRTRLVVRRVIDAGLQAIRKRHYCLRPVSQELTFRADNGGGARRGPWVHDSPCRDQLAKSQARHSDSWLLKSYCWLSIERVYPNELISKKTFSSLRSRTDAV